MRETAAHAFDVTLPYAAACTGPEAATVQVRPLTGEDELLFDEALAEGASAVSAASLLIGRCAARGNEPLGTAARALALGDREVLLRALYAANFGSHFAARVHCLAGCREAIEFDVDVLALTEPAPEPGPRHAIGKAECRVPTGADLEDALRLSGDAAGALVAACGDGVEEAELARELARLDPNAECSLHVACPECGEKMHALLDGLELIRGALAEGGGFIGQVDRLARAYGWSEAEVAALPRARRLRYCALAGGAA